MRGRQRTVSDTQIYRDCDRLFTDVLHITPNFPRHYQHTIGLEMHRICIALIRLVSQTYMTRDLSARIDALTAFQVEFQTLRLLIRKAYELKWINAKKFAYFIELNENIGRQSVAWKNSLSKATQSDSGDEEQDSGGQG